MRYALVLALVSCSQAGGPKPDAGGSRVQTKAEWARTVRAQVAARVCADGEYFRECFRVTRTECLDESKRIVDGCLREGAGDIPDVLDEQAGLKWGQVVGACVGTVYVTVFRSKMVVSDRCTNWTTAAR